LAGSVWGALLLSACSGGSSSSSQSVPPPAPFDDSLVSVSQLKEAHVEAVSFGRGSAMAELDGEGIWTWR